MLSVNEALERILEKAICAAKVEACDLQDCLGRTLAEDVSSKINVPPADNSAMDGYALDSALVTKLPAELPVSQRIAAGSAPSPLSKSSAARIFTGAEIPEGADLVVMQENCEAFAKNGQNWVRILSAGVSGDNIRRVGQDIQAGQIVLAAGQQLEPQHIGLAASVGLQKLRVYEPIKVAIVSTGDELVTPGQPLKTGQIYNSNTPMLQAFIKKLGMQPLVISSLKDDLKSTKMVFQEAAEKAHIVISTGGVSVGEEDHVRAAVEEIGVLHLWKIAVKPGKPLAFGNIANTPFVGLPGNPVSSFVTFMLFAMPLLKKLQGRNKLSETRFQVKSQFERKSVSREEYLRVKISDQGAQLFNNQSSGVLSSLSWADGLVKQPIGQSICAGDMLEFIPL